MVSLSLCQRRQQKGQRRRLYLHMQKVQTRQGKGKSKDFNFTTKYPTRGHLLQEFEAMKPELKRKIGLIMDRHPVFSTALIARRCFASKTASNEYHFGRPGIPVTLRELEEKMMRDVTSIDHFKHLAKVMAERMASAVKGEFASEAKSIKTEVDKLLKGDEPTVNNTSAKNKKASNKENNAVDDKADNPVKTNAKSETPQRKSKRGSQKPAESEKPAPAPRGGRKNAAVNDVSSKASAKKETKKSAKSAPEPLPPAVEVEDNKSKRNRRGKKQDNLETAKKRKQQNENIPNATNDEAANKSEEDSKPKSPPAAPAPAPPVKATGGGRKRKNALAPVNSNRGAKVAKTGAAAASVASGLATKIIPVSPGSKIAVAGSNLVSLSSLSHPLPPQVVLPTTPVAANQVQNIRTSAPPAQVIQLRPTGTVAAGLPPGSMQIRPLRMAGGAGPRPQFFKIVGGKPVQISNLQRLPGAIQPPPGSRVVYMRAPGPTSQAPGTASINAITSVASPVTSAAGGPTSAVTTAATPTGNKIILLSNKGQAIPVSKGAVVSGAPSIVRIVSPNSLTTAGGKLTLAPSSPGKMALKPAPGTTGPILLRTVAPRPVVSSAGGPPIQLPMAPLPKSALTSNAGPEKKTQANDTAKAIQVLLPKSPLPPTTAGLSPQKSPPMGMTTTTTTNANGAFVWTNSTRANFKLSSRINFASLDKFKYVNNKDVQFILASIVTEDKSNEFSFKLHLKREPVAPAKGKKQQQAEQESYLELEGKAKVPTAQEWSLKVKTEPPVFLVSKGNFLADFAAVRIPKEIAEKPFVDYELHIDKCSPMQVAAAASAAAAAAAPPPAKRGRKAAAAKN